MKALITLATICLLAACGGGSSSSSIFTPPSVNAAAFTNANVTGGYAFGLVGTSGNLSQVGTGVVTADGNGNFTGGDETVNIGGVVSCHATFTGTYSINANGTGTVTLNTVLDAASIAKGCIVTGPIPNSLAIASGGATIILSSQGPGGTLLATATRQ
jgi:hypothetical protein